MALGGGTFIAQNKVLPGAYINFISAATANATLSDRGVAAIGLDLDWGEDGKIIEVTQEAFQKDSMKIFGYSFADDKLKGLRDLMKSVTILYAYKLTSDGVKASNKYATAKCSGVRGNDIKIVIQTNVDETNKYDVLTYVGTTLVDKQTVANVTDLIENDYVVFKTDEALEVTASVPLTGGENGTSDAAAHQAFLDKIESYPSINAIGYVGTDNAIKSLYVAFAKRMRDSVGVKFVAVVYDKAADYEGVINVKNKVNNQGENEASMVYWTTGVAAGISVNASATNKKYDGEFDVDTDYTQLDLEKAIKAGEFTFHQVGSEVRVLTDINSLVSLSDEKGEDFQSNQTIRVLDQIAIDIASVFANKYIGKIQNDLDGRVSLWNDIVKHHKDLQTIRAIENFSKDDVVVEKGDNKKSVVVSDAVTPVNCMEKLYMTVVVS